MPKNPADMYVVEFSLREEREARQTGLKFPRKKQAVAAAKRLAKQTGEQVFVNIKDEWKAPFSGRPMVSYWSAYKVADGTVYRYGPSGYYTATDYR